MIKAEIGQYSDFFSNWYGLEDGTLLETNDPSGRAWVKANGETMTVEEWNRRLDGDS